MESTRGCHPVAPRAEPVGTVLACSPSGAASQIAVSAGMLPGLTGRQAVLRWGSWASSLAPVLDLPQQCQTWVCACLLSFMRDRWGYPQARRSESMGMEFLAVLVSSPPSEHCAA